MNKKPFLMVSLVMILLMQSAFSLSQVTNNIDIIAHRGASGFLPEHSKEALVLSFMQGADYIEQDLVATKDKQLVVLHDIHLETVTNVELLFPERARKNGRFYVIDFTLSELRLMTVHERQKADQTQVYPHRYQGNAHFTVATFAEHVELINELNRLLIKNVGIYPEIKAPKWHKSQGVDITELFIKQVRLLQLNNRDQKMFVQSFEPAALRQLRNEFNQDIKLIQLIAENEWGESNADYEALQNDKGLAEIATYAQGIGPWLPQVFNIATETSTGLIERAHAKGLLVHPYTFRTDVVEELRAPYEAFQMLKEAKIDGLFTDQIMPYMLRSQTLP